MAAGLGRSVFGVPVLGRIINPTVVQVRFKRREPVRKPIWMPQAPSKLFKIPPKPERSREEQELLDQLEFNYNAAFTSIVNQCRKQFFLPTLASSTESERAKLQLEQAEEFKVLIRENEAENRRMAADREARRAKELSEWHSYLKQRQIEEAVEKEAIVEKAKQAVEVEIVRSKTFITKDKLLEAIEEALLHPVHYEFAVDWGGRVYTDGTIHPNALKPAAVPETSSHRDLTMQELPSNMRLKAHKLY